MKTFITQRASKLTKIVVFFSALLGLLSLGACQKSPPPQDAPPSSGILESPITSLQSLHKGQLALMSGKVIHTYLALSAQEQQTGLSGIKSDQFSDSEGMLFFNLEEGPRSFWMPDTYFDLDIFFLDKDLKVIDVERNMPAHPGRSETPPIARTRTVLARHVLELRSTSPLAKELNIGSTLQWISSPSLWQIESEIRRRQ